MGTFRGENVDKSGYSENSVPFNPDLYYPVDKKLYRMYRLNPDSQFSFTCSNCGGGMELTATACPYCNVSRQAYLVEVTDKDNVQVPTAPQRMQSQGVILPDFQDQPVNIGMDNTAQLVIGREVHIGSGSRIGAVISERAKIDSAVTIGTLITRYLEIPDSHWQGTSPTVTISHLYSLSEASIVIPAYSKIGHVCIGPDPRILKLGSYTQINQLETAGIYEFDTGYGCEIKAESVISRFFWASKVNHAVAENFSPRR